MNTENNKSDNSALKFLPITGWISTDEATKVIKEHIASEQFDIKKGEIKKSSYRFANGKNKDDGYICKVLLREDKCQNDEAVDGEDKADA